MPFKSKAQMRAFYAMEDRGELPKGTADRWREHTPNINKLPERKRPKSNRKNKKKAFFDQLREWYLRTLSSLAGDTMGKEKQYIPPTSTLTKPEESGNQYTSLPDLDSLKRKYSAPPKIPSPPKPSSTIKGLVQATGPKKTVATKSV